MSGLNKDLLLIKSFKSVAGEVAEMAMESFA